MFFSRSLFTFELSVLVCLFLGDIWFLFYLTKLILNGSISFNKPKFWTSVNSSFILKGMLTLVQIANRWLLLFFIKPYWEDLLSYFLFLVTISKPGSSRNVRSRACFSVYTDKHFLKVGRLSSFFQYYHFGTVRGSRWQPSSVCQFVCCRLMHWKGAHW